MRFIETFGFRLFSDELSKIELTDDCKICNTISPNSYGLSTKDPLFYEALRKTDYLVLDGIYFALAPILLQGKNVQKNQGPDVFDFFIKKMNSEYGSVFFLGSSVETLAKIEKRLKVDYPNVTAGFYSPPFKPVFTPEDNTEIRKQVNDFKPDILFVGMTCPKQEKWAYQNKLEVNAKLICSIGAVFDWYAGNEKPIAPIWWKLRLGWLIRTIHRPEILKRYPNIFIFFRHLAMALAGSKKYKYGRF